MYYNFIHTRKRYAMKIVLEKDAQKHIKEKDKPTRQRIKDAIMKLPAGDIKKLRGGSEFRLRIGDYRVLFRIEDDIIIIRDVLPRGEAYKK